MCNNIRIYNYILFKAPQSVSPAVLKVKTPKKTYTKVHIPPESPKQSAKRKLLFSPERQVKKSHLDSPTSKLLNTLPTPTKMEPSALTPRKKN